jgi:hypothetical protein
MKRLATEKTLIIERKGIDPTSEPNFVQLFLATNEDWAWPAEIDDRRALVMKMSGKHAKDTDYFAAIRNEMEAGGRSALLAFLQGREITSNLRRIPETAALRDQKDLSLKPVESYLLDALHRGTPLTPGVASTGPTDPGRSEWDGVEVLTHVWYDDFKRSNRRNGSVTARSFAMRVAKLIASEPFKHRKSQWHGHRLKSLAECRGHFDRVTQTRREWPGSLNASLPLNQPVEGDQLGTGTEQEDGAPS